MEITIKVNEKEVPVALRMGSLRLLSELFSKEFENVKTLNDIVEVLFCCAKCAARIEGKEFNMSIDEFADGLEMSQVSPVFMQLVEGSGVVVEEPTEPKKK